MSGPWVFFVGIDGGFSAEPVLHEDQRRIAEKKYEKDVQIGWCSFTHFVIFPTGQHA